MTGDKNRKRKQGNNDEHSKKRTAYENAEDDSNQATFLERLQRVEMIIERFFLNIDGLQQRHNHNSTDKPPQHADEAETGGEHVSARLDRIESLARRFNYGHGPIELEVSFGLRLERLENLIGNNIPTSSSAAISEHVHVILLKCNTLSEKLDAAEKEITDLKLKMKKEEKPAFIRLFEFLLQYGPAIIDILFSNKKKYRF